MSLLLLLAAARDARDAARLRNAVVQQLAIVHHHHRRRRLGAHEWHFTRVMVRHRVRRRVVTLSVCRELVGLRSKWSWNVACLGLVVVAIGMSITESGRTNVLIGRWRWFNENVSIRTNATFVALGVVHRWMVARIVASTAVMHVVVELWMV